VLDYEQNVSVLTGPEGLLENMAPGGCIFICSTISPAQARDLADLAADQGLRLLDCPVSGGQEGAMAGTLSLMIGGDRSAVEEHRGALEAISDNIYHLGNVGAGESAKAVNQLLVAVHNAATAEALLLAAKGGIDLKQMAEIISTSAGQSWIFEHRAMRMIERDFTPRGVLKILLKDTSIVSDMAESHGLILPLATAARQLFQAGVNSGLEDEDDAAVVKVLEALANFSLPHAMR
jgi:3-hydroxyisobutyrate dehydrogenase